jgi:hypothetical protein
MSAEVDGRLRRLGTSDIPVTSQLSGPPSSGESGTPCAETGTTTPSPMKTNTVEIRRIKATPIEALPESLAGRPRQSANPFYPANHSGDAPSFQVSPGHKHDYICAGTRLEPVRVRF